MPHMMDDFPLLLSTLYDRGVRLYPDQELVAARGGGELERSTYAATDVRVRRLATALAEKLRVRQGQPVATFAWNDLSHHEIYWATANTGRICHTLNIRLHPEQLVYVVNHARDRVLFVDPGLAPLVAPLVDRFETVETYVVLGADADAAGIPGAIAYEELIDGVEPWGEWPRLDERSPMMYCYTSGTTGNPKGVAYTQRSTYLHTIANLAFYELRASDNVLPVVPMFHAAAWGYPFMAVTAGAKLTYPGPDLSPAALVSLFERERVTISTGVPTVWFGIQQHLMEHPEADLSSIRCLFCGGSAVPRAMIDWFGRERNINVYQGWGMTETNPVASLALLKPEMRRWEWEEQLDRMETAGLWLPGLEIKIVDDRDRELPHDDEAQGELLIRGPWVAGEYLRDPDGSDRFTDGWLRTGDVCRVTPDGYIRIVDRAKDVIKSGGEWISSVELEGELMAHPEVAEAAVFAAPHPKWQERPVAAVVRRPRSEVTKEELLAHLEPRVAKWWLPDEILFVAEIPKTGTGKFDKKVLREEHAAILGG